MIRAGKSYLDLSEQRNLVLIDTEMVLGHPELGYVGQPDKVWLTMNAKGDEFGLVITDWKTNKEKTLKLISLLSQCICRLIHTQIMLWDTTTFNFHSTVN